LPSGASAWALVLYGQTSANLTPREKGKLVPALLRLSSPDFGDGEPIPEPSSKDGGNYIPTLHWNAPPEGTVELAILCDDPDTPVGTWVHWVAAGIDPQTRRIEGQLPGGAIEGANDFKESGYGGPQPPPGDGVHRYFFYLYALREPSGLAAGCTADDLRRAVVGKELARGVLIGTFVR
jgi:Raf kinase inhibitor-like YbhB/YbcL family protein